MALDSWQIERDRFRKKVVINHPLGMLQSHGGRKKDRDYITKGEHSDENQ
jgi:hypothetical protein